MTILRLLPCAAVFCLTIGTAGAQVVPMVPHKAIYDLSLGKATGNKSPTSLQGQIALDFSGSACDGYTTNFRQFTELQPAEGQTRVSDMRTATFEDGDAASFRFRIQTFMDSAQAEDIDGRAKHSSDGGLSVSLTRPKLTKLDQESEILFPTQHLRRIIDEARKDVRVLEVKAFDGAETGEKIYNTLSIIGQLASAPAPEAAAQLDALKGVRRWPVSISYFEAGKPDARPDYVLSFDLYENGISRALRINYGDFTVRGDMSKLEILPAPACAK